jgi:hypothetical protein
MFQMMTICSMAGGALSMPRRKSLVQVNFRMRQDTLRKLEREAKRHDRSTNDEIVYRLENSLAHEDWREIREQLLLAMRTNLGRQLSELPDESTQEDEVGKPRNSRLIQARFRLRQEIIKRLEREAKRNARSTNDEIGIRLQESFSQGDSWKELMSLLSALIADVGSHPDPVQTKAAYIRMEKRAERAIHDEIMGELSQAS